MQPNEIEKRMNELERRIEALELKTEQPVQTIEETTTETPNGEEE